MGLVRSQGEAAGREPRRVEWAIDAIFAGAEGDDYPVGAQLWGGESAACADGVDAAEGGCVRGTGDRVVEQGAGADVGGGEEAAYGAGVYELEYDDTLEGHGSIKPRCFHDKPADAIASTELSFCVDFAAAAAV